MSALQFQIMNTTQPKHSLYARDTEIILAQQDSSFYHSITQFIAGGFFQSFSAQITHFMPNLLAIKTNALMDRLAHSATAPWQAALGIRCARYERLFVEQYVEQPIEQCLAQHQMDCTRAEIAEIGNLYASNKRYTLLLFVMLAELLHKQGLRYVVCCVTSMLENLLVRHGIPMHFLQDADPSRLGATAAEYGRYYQCAPRVMCFDLNEALAVIRSNDHLNTLALPYLATLDLNKHYDLAPQASCVLPISGVQA